ncbi:MAG: anthranilate phosphoribosyltransferase, partial [Desulfobacterales bacterium]|nr:anthranilate phosphoribosyltransferase [Desulfobacterales bacterium]
GIIRTYDIDPEQFFGKLADPDDLKGGDPKMNATITRSILNGDQGPKREIVVLNAAAALVTAGKSKDLREGIELAEESIDQGAAASKLEALIKFTQENG